MTKTLVGGRCQPNSCPPTACWRKPHTVPMETTTQIRCWQTPTNSFTTRWRSDSTMVSGIDTIFKHEHISKVECDDRDVFENSGYGCSCEIVSWRVHKAKSLWLRRTSSNTKWLQSAAIWVKSGCNFCSSTRIRT